MKIWLKCAFILVVGCAFMCPMSAQVVPAAQQGVRNARVGINYADYYSGIYGHLQGPGIWLDWFPQSRVQGLGIEVEARDLNYGRKSYPIALNNTLRQDTIMGGIIYRYERKPLLQPFAKFGMGYGSMDWTDGPGKYYHDSRTITVFGGGLDFRVHRNIWVRGGYDYQYWPNFGTYKSAGKQVGIHPNGFAIGVAYDFNR